MEKRRVIKDLSWSVPYDAAVKFLRVSEDDEEEFKDTYDEVLPLLEPVCYLGEDAIEHNDGHQLTVGGQIFTSRVVCVNLESSDKVYPYVFTSGRKAYEYAIGLDDDLYKFWAHGICEIALKSFGASVYKMVKEELGTENVFNMGPGSVIDWPITEQKPLFALLGDVYENTGIELSDTFLMHPIKSGSGFYYVSEKHFASCMLCPRNGCPNRKAPFDSEKFKREYGE